MMSMKMYNLSEHYEQYPAKLTLIVTDNTVMCCKYVLKCFGSLFFMCASVLKEKGHATKQAKSIFLKD